MSTRRTVRIVRPVRRINKSRIIRTTRPATNTTPGNVATIARERKIRSFAVVLDGHTLAPRYYHQDLLIVDTEQTPKPGDAALIAFPPGTETVRVMIVNADGDMTDLRGGYLERGSFEILGTVTEARPWRP